MRGFVVTCFALCTLVGCASSRGARVSVHDDGRDTDRARAENDRARVSDV